MTRWSSIAPSYRNLSADPIVAEAQQRFDQGMAWESTARSRWLDDFRFANADAYNGYQWQTNIRRGRDLDDMPSLTINHIQQHNGQILNDAKQNKSGIVVRPVGEQASYDSAQVWMGIIRHIEYISNAQNVYDTAMKFQVDAGIGYWRVVTDYAHDETFDHEIYLKRIKNPLNVLCDPDMVEFDGTDMRWGLIFDDVPRDQFELKYPKYIKYAGQAALGAGDWCDDDHVRVVEYYRKIEQDDWLLQIDDGQGKITNVRGSDLPKIALDQLLADKTIKRRKVKVPKVEWHFIVGDKKVESAEWPGQYVPIVRLVGKETIIDGILDRAGHTRAMLDPQRMYNYWCSSAVQYVALQGKTPWVGPAEAFEGFEEYWKTANRVNHSFLPYNHRADDSEVEIPAPQRAAPPQQSDAYLKGMSMAQQELMAVSGQFEAMSGGQGNERSAKALMQRQGRGDNATYHFIDHLAIALRATGKIILDIAPKIYDTARVLKILNEDGTDDDVQLQPTMQAAYQEYKDRMGKTVARIFNPTVGRYEVHADMGPAYATRRQQAFDAMLQIITQNPNFAQTIGDLRLSSADFPKADEAARRLRNLVPPQALGEGPPPEVQQLQQTIQQLQELLQDSMTKQGKLELKLAGRSELREVNVYDAETRRMAALNKVMPTADPAGLVAIIRDLVNDALQTDLLSIMRRNSTDPSASGLREEQPPMTNAKKGKDGHWYVPDEQRPGSYARIKKRQPAQEHLETAMNGGRSDGAPTMLDMLMQQPKPTAGGTNAAGP